MPLLKALVTGYLTILDTAHFSMPLLIVLVTGCNTMLDMTFFNACARRTARKYFACFAAVTAARNSASVLEVAVVD